MFETDSVIFEGFYKLFLVQLWACCMSRWWYRKYIVSNGIENMWKCQRHLWKLSSNVVSCFWCRYWPAEQMMAQQALSSNLLPNGFGNVWNWQRHLWILFSNRWTNICLVQVLACGAEDGSESYFIKFITGSAICCWSMGTVQVLVCWPDDGSEGSVSPVHLWCAGGNHLHRLDKGT